ncbi:MAG: hypothetical protein ACYTAS_23435, partial [Planctomycetota bacterium]
NPHSPGVIAIHDMTGRLLYRVWHIGAPSSGYWMRDAKLLVLAGLNSEANWPERIGIDVGAEYPWVVFALEPRLGHLGQTWTEPPPGTHAPTLAWYQCVLPPDGYSDLTKAIVTRPLPGYDPGRFAGLDLDLKDTTSGISWVVDSAGKEVPGTRTPNTRWQIDKPFPTDFFKLGPLPPILPASPGN